MAFEKRPGFERGVSTPSSFDVELAEREIFKTYGDTVSVFQKGKTFLQFGKNLDVDTGSTETVWTTGGNETYVTSNLIDTISSSNAGDSQDVIVEGHTVSGTGVNQQFTFVSQTVTLNGQNKVTLSTPLARVSKISNNNTSNFSGDIYVYEDTAITAGVPSDLTKVHIKVVGTIGDNQSFKAAMTVSNNEYFICTGGLASVRKQTAASVDFTLQVRPPGSMFRGVAEITLNSTGSGFADIDFRPYVIIPKNYDIRIVVESDTNNAQVTGALQGYIAEVI
jgi:hypothetical protein